MTRKEAFGMTRGGVRKDKKDGVRSDKKGGVRSDKGWRKGEVYKMEGGLKK